MQDQDWQLLARCVGDCDMTTGDRDVAREAVKRCAGCPVIVECEAWAAGQGAFEGIAAGRWYLKGHPQPIPPRVERRAVYATDELRAGHSAWVRGIRTDATRELERLYQHARYQRRKRPATVR